MSPTPAPPKEPATQPAPERRLLSIFISYSSEDREIAEAVRNALYRALGDAFLDVFVDKTSLEFGLDYRNQLTERLDQTDVLVIIYTGVLKPSHGFTGWEVGYFQGVNRKSSERLVEHRTVPIFLSAPPAAAADSQGLALDISRDRLQLSEQEFLASLALDAEHTMVRFIDELKDELAKIREAGRFPKALPTNTADCVREMLLAIFRHLKNTVDLTLKPQKQITVRTSVNSLRTTDNVLPDDAILTPVGSGSPMSIFGLPEQAVSWKDFLSQTADHKMSAPWRDAITSVISSSLPNHIDVDNSQIIFSSDSRRVYRLIMTASTTYFNGNREFNLYLVESLRPNEFGRRDTTLLLKGLELVCRFRFMFLETSSEFYSINIMAMSQDRVPSLARRMVRELNLLVRDSREAGLDQPNVWSQFVDWDDILAMSKVWAEHDPKVREIAAEIGRLGGSSDQLKALRERLAEEVSTLSKRIKPFNKRLIERMSQKLQEIVSDENEGTVAAP